jgi:hypothetical protein
MSDFCRLSLSGNTITIGTQELGYLSDKTSCLPETHQNIMA